MVLAVNGNQIASTSLRHRLVYYQALDNPTSFTLQLDINNVVKQDEGRYQCQMSYIQGSSVQTYMKAADVIIQQYLPALNFPECSLEPSVVLSEGDLATFNCIVGNSNPPVNLTLALIRADRSEQLIEFVQRYNNRNASVTFPVNTTDNNTRLVCYMRSDTFPTAYRSCYAGPIEVLPQKILPITNSITAFSMEITTHSEPATVTTGSTSTNKIEPNGTVNASTWGIVGGVIGAFVASVTFIIIILVMRSKQPSDENIAMASSSNQMDGSSNSNQQPPAQHHPYTAHQKHPEPESYSALNRTNVSPSSVQQSDHSYTTYQKQDPEPHAILNQTNVSPSSEHSADHSYTTYQKQPDPEPYSALNQMPPPSPTAMTFDPDYQNVHDYTAIFLINGLCIVYCSLLQCLTLMYPGWGQKFEFFCLLVTTRRLQSGTVMGYCSTSTACCWYTAAKGH